MQWRPTASIENLKLRAVFLEKIRTFFKQKNYLEVETPYMGRYPVTDIHLKNIEAGFRGETYYLQTSPEYHMKRLLAAGSGPIMQIARVFRDDEHGRWHNPEFSLLEWYQLDVDHWYLVDEIEQLFQLLFPKCLSFKKMSYQQAFELYLGIDPLKARKADLIQVCAHLKLHHVLDLEEDFDQYLHLLMATVIEPNLAKLPEPVVIYNFPASQACLARLDGPTARRFEIYWRGIELANGFHELSSKQEQEARFEQDISMSKLAKNRIDRQFLAALEHGLPDCSGVALGLDRLLSLYLQKENIQEVMAFAFPEL